MDMNSATKFVESNKVIIAIIIVIIILFILLWFGFISNPLLIMLIGVVVGIGLSVVACNVYKKNTNMVSIA